MSPTIPTAANVEQHKRPTLVKPSSAERRSDLICRVKYCNTLPDIPFDPKFLQYPFESTRFIQYNPTSLERNYKYEVLTEHDLGVTIDLINKDQYAADPDAVLDPADEKLLEEDILTPHDSKRSRHHSRSVSWLRKTEYISTEQTRFQPQVMDKVEAKVGFSIKKHLKDETVYMDRDSQIKAIEKTFEDAKIPIEKHHSKPNVVPVEILPLYPDYLMWKYPCAQVIFDSDPAPQGKSVPAQLEVMSQAMIRGVMDESGEQFVAYFLPTEGTLEKRRRDFANGIDYEDEEEYDYRIAREYNWNVKTKASKGYEENYFLVMRQDGVFYNELETRVRLSKRRQKAGTAPNNTRLVVRHRPMDAAEFNIHRLREKQLQHPIDEEEEDEESAGEEDKKEEEDKKSDRKSEDESGSDREGSRKDNESDKDSDKENRADESDKENRDGSDKGNKSDDSDKENKSDEESDKGNKSDEESEKGNKSDDSDKGNQSDEESEKGHKSDDESDKGNKSDNESDKGHKSEDESDKGNKSDDESEKGNKSDEESEKGNKSEDSDKENKSDEESEKGNKSEDSDKENKSDVESDKEEGAGRGSGSEKSPAADSDAESSASGRGSGSQRSGSASSNSGSDDDD